MEELVIPELSFGISDLDEPDSTPFPRVSHQELRQEQNADEILSVWMTALRQNKITRLFNTPNINKHAIKKRNWEKLFFETGCYA